jgi:hypothetical protein
VEGNLIGSPDNREIARSNGPSGSVAKGSERFVQQPEIGNNHGRLPLDVDP